MELKIEIDGKIMEAAMKVVGDTMVVSPKIEKYEPKDGDVVYVDTGNKNIIIYREQQNKVGRYVNYINEQHLYIDTCDFCGSIYDIIEIRPATEEEKKELFDKLAEEGYEWKAETKELVKLKWKPSMYDPYYIPFYETCEFIPMGTNWNGRNKDNIRYNKGLCFKTEEECQEFCNRLNQAIEGVKP